MIPALSLGWPVTSLVSWPLIGCLPANQTQSTTTLEARHRNSPLIAACVAFDTLCTLSYGLRVSRGRKRKHNDRCQAIDNGDSDEEQGADTPLNTLDINVTRRASHLNDRHTPSLVPVFSVTSRTSSPTKRSRRLAVEADGFVHHVFPRSSADLPPSLARLVKELQDNNGPST